ncbi:hypothetical protein H6G64_34260 [Calothrix sp. FACHB-156]|nr:hypothetical protein [Calothrix sp. FACHB-156]
MQVFGHISAQDSTKAIALRLLCSSFSIPPELKGAIAPNAYFPREPINLLTTLIFSLISLRFTKIG